MFKFALPVLALLISSNASAAETWVGYKPVEKTQAPQKEFALNSVVEMKTVTLLETEPTNYDVVDVAREKKVTSSKKLNSDYRVLQVETCRNQGLAKCPVFFSTYSGTAFIKKGREIYTCRHMLHNWVRLAASLNNLDLNEISPPMWLKDHKTNIIYNSATTKDLIRITINQDPRLDYVLREITSPRENKEDLLYYQSEYAEMHSPVDLVKPLDIPVASVPSMKEGDPVYFSGYPAKTEYFKSNNKGDTPGKILVSSVGKFIAYSRALQLFLSDNMGTGGLSGGLVSDKNGSLIGIFCRSDDIVDPAILMATSEVFDPAAQKALWETLEKIPLEKLTLP